jgi:hypothetical protein
MVSRKERGSNRVRGARRMPLVAPPLSMICSGQQAYTNGYFHSWRFGVHLFAEHDSRVLLLLHQHHSSCCSNLTYIITQESTHAPLLEHVRTPTISSLRRYRGITFRPIVRARLFYSSFIRSHEKTSATRFSEFGSHHHVSERLLKGVPW